MEPELAKRYPADAELRSLVDSFEAGDYRAVREGTARIAADANKSDEVKAAARDLRSRTEASPTQIALLVIAALMVIALSTYEVVQHGRSAPRPEPPQPAIEHVR